MNDSAVPSLVFNPRPGRTLMPLRLLAPTLVFLLIASSACASSAKGTGYRPAGNKMQITPSQLQVKVRALADPFSGIIEETV